MAIEIPAFVTLQNASWFLRTNSFFDVRDNTAVLRFHPRWAHLEPFGLVMLAAWGRWCQREGVELRVENLGRTADYAWRMHLFDHLGIDYAPDRREWEEAGRFLPVTQVRTGEDIRKVIG